VLQPGSHSCYKALYFNVERATFVIAGVLLLLLVLLQAINAHRTQMNAGIISCLDAAEVCRLRSGHGIHVTNGIISGATGLQ
jgi:hypothetical protein